MPKRRLYEIAKEMGLPLTEVFDLLAQVGIEKRSGFNTIEDEEYQALRELFAGPPAPPAPPPPEAEAKVEVKEREKPRGLPRPPVVTVLGHVDHGKTTLLDYIRKSHVAQREVGGITQAIGAYQVEYNGKKITFIDTPGHRAFTQMRQRGAQATDIAVLVVAADDGVMAQTKEAISHAKAANVPIIVALNKMDKREADPDKVKEQLVKEGLTPEEWGGETIVVPLSALTGQNVDELLEMILLVAEMEDLRADPSKPAEGIIIESYLDRARGPVATVIVKDGTLHERDIVLAGTACGRVRTLLNEHGQRMAEAPPGSAAQILGLSDVPPAGIKLEVVSDLEQAKNLACLRKEEERAAKLAKTQLSAMERFQQQLRKAQVKELKLILKADTVGSLEALQGELSRLKVEGIDLVILHSGVGNINENDVLLASSEEEGVVIVGFRVEIDRKIGELAQAQGVMIKRGEIIYELTDWVEELLKSAVTPRFEEVKIGELEVRNTFNIPKVGVVAGCYVRAGVVTRDAHVRVLRDGAEVFQGPIRSLRRFNDDVKEVEQGKECGLRIENFNDVRKGDLLEIFVRKKFQPA
ncbi:MAG: translation initiation factor IF-2 [Candidatus Acetothermia bacterium]|jgi:translation initiation factor IF-2|nr:translation initiation factor IF-2 [Candidatus Acetothermia bacterium]MDH7504948.1 translation initiation factor IF-2 [Candidatus Acetothermia bacterium]